MVVGGNRLDACAKAPTKCVLSAVTLCATSTINTFSKRCYQLVFSFAFFHSCSKQADEVALSYGVSCLGLHALVHTTHHTLSAKLPTVDKHLSQTIRAHVPHLLLRGSKQCFQLDNPRLETIDGGIRLCACHTRPQSG